ncbi:MAG: hypothetical protein ACI4UV_13100, partial [Victivallales bacterium]
KLRAVNKNKRNFFIASPFNFCKHKITDKSKKVNSNYCFFDQDQDMKIKRHLGRHDSLLMNRQH